MPNHIHGILIITENTVGTGNVETGNVGTGTVGTGNVGTGTVGTGTVGTGTVETGHALSLPPPSTPPSTPTPTPHTTPPNTTSNEPFHKSPEPPQTIGQQRFQNIGKNSISSIVGSYKSAVSKHAHRLQFDFQWQTRFYDHIIRDDQSFQRISAYIVNNPVNWREDKFHKSDQ